MARYQGFGKGTGTLCFENLQVGGKLLSPGGSSLESTETVRRTDLVAEIQANLTTVWFMLLCKL